MQDSLSCANVPFSNSSTLTVNYPDVLMPQNNATVCLGYDGVSTSTGVAGIQFSGMFPGGTAEGKVVVLGVPLESMYYSANRSNIMGKVLAFLTNGDAGSTPNPTPTTPATYTVVSGDTGYGIASKFDGIEWSDIAAWNDLSVSDPGLYVGQILRLSPSEEVVNAAPIFEISEASFGTYLQKKIEIIASDPENDSYTARIDWGDGDAIYTDEYSVADTFTVEHTYNADGNYTISITMFDAYNTTEVKTLDVSAEAPK